MIVEPKESYIEKGIQPIDNKMYGMMYPSPDKMMSSMNPKGGSGPGGGGIVGGPGSGLPGTNCFSGRYSPTYRVPDQMRDPMRRCMTNTPAVSHRL